MPTLTKKLAGKKKKKLLLALKDLKPWEMGLSRALGRRSFFNPWQILLGGQGETPEALKRKTKGPLCFRGNGVKVGFLGGKGIFLGLFQKGYLGKRLESFKIGQFTGKKNLIYKKVKWEYSLFWQKPVPNLGGNLKTKHLCFTFIYLFH